MAQLQQNYISQDVAPEQEDLKSPPPASEYYYDQYSRNNESRFILEKRSWKTLKQNNSSGKYLTDKELEYVGLINGFLKTSRYGIEYFTIDYLCEELEITDRQLRTIRTNTSHVFKTKWKKAPRTHKGRLKNVYAIRPTEHTVFLLGETNYYKSKYNSFVNHFVKSVKLGSQLPTSYNKYENNINIRSRANFANVKNSDSQNLGTEPEEAKNLAAKGSCVNSQANQQAPESFETPNEPQVVETTSPKAATVTPIRTKAPRPRNKRKTRINAEEKQRRVANAPVAKTTQNVVPNGFLGKGKRLSEIQPYLTDELCEKLRSSSGKLFTNKAIREITKAIAASENGSQAFFYHINGVVSYLTPALVKEKRDPNKIGAEGYYTLAGMTEEDKLLRKQEQFLESVELTAMRQACPENQFKGKLVGTLGRRTAYNLLFAMKHTTLRQNTLVISLTSHVELTEHQQRIILAQAQAVFNCTDLHGNSHHVERVVFKTDKVTSHAADTVAQSQIELPQGIWGKVAKSFIEEYGHDLYTHWLGDKVEAKEDTEQQTIYLKASSDMVKDRIEQAYLPFLSKIGMNFGINKLEVVV